MLSKFQNTKYAVFMDLVENSMLDIMLVTDLGSDQASRSGEKKQSIHTIYNNL